MSHYDHEYTEDVYFASRLPYDPSRESLWPVLCRYLQRDIPENGVVLELGGGYCYLVNNIRASEKHVVDLNPAIRKYSAKDVSSHVQSCADLDEFKTESFDAVFASNLFEHLSREDLDRTLADVHRILRTGGKLLVIQPNFRYSYKTYFDDYTHLQIFTHLSLRDLLIARRFHPIKVVPRFLPFSLKSRLPKWGWLLRCYLMLPYRPMAAQMYIVAQKRSGLS